MSYTNEDVCNIALSHIGEYQITSIYADGNIERLCRLHLPLIRRTMLRSHAWNFALYREELVISAEENIFGYEFRYNQPDDYLMALQLFEDVDGRMRIRHFKVEGQAILCDHGTAFMEYVADVDCPEMWTTDFVELLALKLAISLCVPLGSGARKEGLMQEFEQLAKPQAWLNNSREDASDENNPLAEIVQNSNYVRQNEHEI